MRKVLLTGVSFLALGLLPAALAQTQGGGTATPTMQPGQGQPTPQGQGASGQQGTTAQPGTSGQGGVAVPQLDETYRSYSELYRTQPRRGGTTGTDAPGAGAGTGAGAGAGGASAPGGAGMAGGAAGPGAGAGGVGAPCSPR